jgi:hypothetical protein
MDYLGAVADSIRPDDTRALVASARSGDRAHGRGSRMGSAGFRAAQGGRRWRGWTVPLAAAVSVIGVVALGLVLPRAVGGLNPQTAAPSGTASMPAYYLQLDGYSGSSVVVRSVRSGTGTTIPGPRGSNALTVAAAPGNRTFYVVYALPVRTVTGGRDVLYSFSVLRSGRITTPTPVKGGSVTYANAQQILPAIAVSPDGRQIAMLVSTTKLQPISNLSQNVANEIVVIDLRTGTRRVWSGGLNRTGYTVTVRSLSWAVSGRSLDFLATWCRQGHPYGGACNEVITEQGATSQVRSLHLAERRGSLADSTVLFSQPRFVARMVAAAGGRFDLMTLQDRARAEGLPRGLAIGQYSADGRLRRVLYQHDYASAPRFRFIADASLTADSSGQWPLVGLVLAHCAVNACYTGDTPIGWLGGGTFHPLPSHANWLSQVAW